MSRLTLSGGAILTMDEDDVIIPEGSVVIEDGAIVDVLPGTVSAGRTIDCRGKAVLPGLVNAHAHCLEAPFRGMGGELPFLPWVERAHLLFDQLDEQGAYMAVRLATAEMLKSGVTAFVDPEIPADQRFEGMARAAVDSRLRAGLTITTEDQAGYHNWAFRESPAVQQPELDMIARWDKQAAGRVRAWIGPSVLSAVSPELGRSVREVADRLDLGIAFHFAEIPEDVEDPRERMGVGPLEFARRCELVTPKTLMTHAVRITPEEITEVAAIGASIVHCPSSNAKLGNGIAPLPALLDARVNVALGTDGGTCNDTYDLMAEMRLAGLIHRAASRDTGATSALQILRLATANGARALRLETCGVIGPGRAADVAILNLRRIGSWPTFDLPHALVFSANRGCVETVLVNGEALLTGGEVVDVDEQQLLRDAEELARDAFQRAGIGVAPSAVS